MNDEIILCVSFYKSESGNEPVRDWLKALSGDDRKIIGSDIQTVQYGWPLGMPLVGKMDIGLWEIRSRLTDSRIARVFFTVGDNEMALLHGIVKKSQKTPKTALDAAKRRRNNWKKGE